VEVELPQSYPLCPAGARHTGIRHWLRLRLCLPAVWKGCEAVEKTKCLSS